MRRVHDGAVALVGGEEGVGIVVGWEGGMGIMERHD